MQTDNHYLTKIIFLMADNLYLDRINAQIKSKKPFVLYSDFGKNSIQAQLQSNAEVYKTSSFTEQGFVFAPFDLEVPTYIIPNASSELLQIHEIPDYTRAFTPVANSSESSPHKQLIKKAIETINATELEKVVLARTASLTFSKMDVIALFLSLAAAYPKAYTYCWYHPNTGFWLGASPETLLEVENKKFKTMALAGTQEFTGSTNVKWDEKNHEEQQFVTSYLKTTLEKHALDIEISTPKTIRAGKLLHLQTTLAGTLFDAPDVLKALISSIHPTPAVCGTPKTLAMSFIKANETIDRAYYSGFLGQINTPKNNSLVTNLVVNLRCMHLNGNEATLYAGGGITSKSNPETEWDETEAKLRTITSVL